MGTDYSRSYPITSGTTVTQGHADWCAAHGHATVLHDGEPAPWCPRCGENI